MNNQLYSFVKGSLEKGLDRAAIRDALLQAGWQVEDVRNVLSSFAEIDFPVPVPRPKPYLVAREAFLYLVSFITLYFSAISFGTLMFVFIDRAFPDPLDFGRGLSSGPLTTAISSIVITFPLYLLLMWRLGKDAATKPEQRQSRVRKWLTYLTLVVAAGIIIGDLIALLSNLLDGDITVRFTLKVMTILAITGCIFGYYLWDLRQSEQEDQT